VIGGAEWRLTLFAYAFYLVAAFWLVEAFVRLARKGLSQWRSKEWPRPTSRRVLRPAAALFALLAVTGVWLFAVPYAVAREALTYGDAAMIPAGPRDRWFFVDGWSQTVLEGNVTSRLAIKQPATLRIFLPQSRPYELTIRVDPTDPSAADRQVVTASLNGDHLEDLVLGWNPDRIGQYEVTIPAGIVAPGVQHLTLHSTGGFKLWYVLITPK
jgi:hypothetical protein